MRFLDIQQVLTLERQLQHSLWLVASYQGVLDLDSGELLEAVHANLRRGVEYRVILPDDCAPAEPMLGGVPSYQVRLLPRSLLRAITPFQLNDPERRTRRGFCSIRQRTDDVDGYFWIPMDRDDLEAKITAFRHLWTLDAMTLTALDERTRERRNESTEVFRSRMSGIVDDEPTAKLLLRDFDNALVARDLALWKLSYVCFMGIVETLLGDVLVRAGHIPGDKQPPSFHDLIEMARARGIISAELAGASQALRATRNVVHPERELRSRIVVDRELVEIARHFLARLLAELERISTPSV